LLPAEQQEEYGVSIGTARRATAAAVLLAACSGGTGGQGADGHGTGVPAGSSTGTAAGGQGSSAVPLAAVRSAMKGAQSVHISGHLLSHGTVMTVDISVTRSGDLFGTVTEGGVPITILDTGGKFYILATKTFLALERIPRSKCTAVCGKYVAEPPQASGGFANLHMAAVLSEVAAALPKNVRADRKTVVYHGKPAVSFTAGGETLDLADGKLPLPLLVIGPGGKTDVELSDWNKAAIPAAPGAAQIARLR
jgi:hypothetical protein